MSELQPYQQRVIEEKRDLYTKIIALCAFIHSDEYRKTVPDYTDRIHVELQFKAMMDYSRALAERIENFNQGN